VLVIGYGNPGRLDDGLGPALAAALEQKKIPGLTVDSDYQLTVEDAHALADADVVVFADADVSGPEPFYFRRLEPKGSNAVGSHGVEPGEVLELARGLFHASCEAFVLGIRGYEFNAFGEGLSERARANLDEARAFIEAAVRCGRFETVNE
jgi:hydrogenase maturation protease